MIVRPSAVKDMLRDRADVQVAESAVIALCSDIERHAANLVDRAVKILRARNELREVQRLEPLRRVTDREVAEALRGGGGNA